MVRLIKMEATNSNQPIVEAPQKVNKNNNFLVSLLSILLLLACIIAGFFAYQTQKLVKELTEQRNLVTPSPISTPTADPTVDWKTYTNEKYGFSFKCPSDWTDLASKPEDVLFFKSIDDQIHFVVKKSTSINQLIQELGIKNQENITFNDIKFTKISYDTKPAGNIVEYVIAKNNDLLIFSGNVKVLSTFKFTDSVACTEEAKTCPDGSSVGRIGPNCEFAKCPATSPQP